MADESLRLLLPRQLRELPADLAAVVILVLVTNLSVLPPVDRETPLRIVFGLAFVLFLPGYAFIAALFPEDGAGPADEGEDSDDTADTVASGGTRCSRPALHIGRNRMFRRLEIEPDDVTLGNLQAHRPEVERDICRIIGEYRVLVDVKLDDVIWL